MIRLEPGMRCSDIEQWVGNAFFLTPHGDGYVPAEVTWWPERDEDGEFYDEDCQYCIRLLDGSERQVRFAPDEAVHYIYPHWPICGSINLLYNKLAVHVERLQMKQWRRTFNFRQVKVHTPQAWALTGGAHVLNDHNLVQAVFDPQYPSSPMELDAWFADGFKSVALTPHVIVTNTQPMRLVYYNGELACKLRADGTFDTIDVRLTHLLTKLYARGIRV